MGTVHRPARRALLAGTAAGAVAATAVAVLPRGALAAGDTGAAGTSRVRPDDSPVARARDFLALLSAERRAVAAFGFDHPLRARWNYFGPAPKPGLRLEQMRADERAAALALLATVLCPDGMAKFDRVRNLQDVLRLRGDGPSDRSAGRFSFAVFGEPAPGVPWGFRAEGHHLSLSFTLVGDEVVAVTPSSFSSNPNLVVGGPHDGLVALGPEHADAARLIADLSATNDARSLIAEAPYRNILSSAGREDSLFGAAPEGVALGDLTTAQRELALRVVDAYAVDHLVPRLAEAQARRVREGDPEQIRLGRAGGTRPGELMYYRLHGPTFVIELATAGSNPYHLHTIRHDPERHLGRHVVG